MVLGFGLKAIAKLKTMIDEQFAAKVIRLT